MTDKEIIDAYRDYLEVERGYSEYTLLNYMNDINDFITYLDNKKYKGICNLSLIHI